MTIRTVVTVVLIAGCASAVGVSGQAPQPGINYDESLVGTYVLPPVLGEGADQVRSREEWPERRSAILELFREHVYGRRPGKPESLNFEVIETDPEAVGGTATLSRVAIVSGHEGREHRFEVVVLLPNDRQGAVPTFLLLNNRPASNTDPTRAEKSPFWPAEEMLERGYGIAALQVGDLAPDDADTFTEGVIRLFEGDTASRPDDAWMALAAWGWGASRALDYFETNPRIDSDRVAVVGHSRGGKAALWAGAEDERFALVVSNDSGEGGAALARRDFGETVERINTQFPHWFTANYKQYNGRPADLPVDQHMLLALVAPRALYVASAQDDAWADPRGEFLSLSHSSPAYELFGEAAIGPDDMPAVDTPLVVGSRGYHVRTGGHNLTTYDWMRFADLADSMGWSE